jgi:hypothetical protein
MATVNRGLDERRRIQGAVENNAEIALPVGLGLLAPPGA